MIWAVKPWDVRGREAIGEKGGGVAALICTRCSSAVRPVIGHVISGKVSVLGAWWDVTGDR